MYASTLLGPSCGGGCKRPRLRKKLCLAKLLWLCHSNSGSMHCSNELRTNHQSLQAMSNLSLPSTIAVSSTIPAVVYLGYLMYSQGKAEKVNTPNLSTQLSWDKLEDKLTKVQRSRLDTIQEEKANDSNPWQ